MSALRSSSSWQYRNLNSRVPGLGVLSGALIELVEEGYPVMVGTADVQHSNGLVRFAARHPERFVQFGISEQHMVSAAAGMAAARLQELARTLPLERLLLETDSPFLSPFRGRNEPANVRTVAQKIAELRGLSWEEVARTTTGNAALLFGS